MAGAIKKAMYDTVPPAEPAKLEPIEDKQKESSKDTEGLARQYLLTQRQMMAMILERDMLRALVMRAAFSNELSFASHENTKKRLEAAKKQLEGLEEEKNKLRKQLGKVMDKPMFHEAVQTDQGGLTKTDILQSNVQGTTDEEELSCETGHKHASTYSINPKYVVATAGAIGLGIAVYKFFF